MWDSGSSPLETMSRWYSFLLCRVCRACRVVCRVSAAQEAYTSALDALGIAYDIVDAYTLTLGDIHVVSAYPVLFFFTGSNGAIVSGSPTSTSHSRCVVLCARSLVW